MIRKWVFEIQGTGFAAFLVLHLRHFFELRIELSNLKIVSELSFPSFGV